jgi:hypothetical protein
MRFIFFIAVCFLANGVQAQRYTTAAGIRVGTDLGLSVQQLLFKQNTLELIGQASLLRRNYTATALWEKHSKLLGRRFNFYIGAGPHFSRYTDRTLGSTNAYGASLIGGLELTLRQLNISFDVKPQFNLVGGFEFFDNQAALSLRMVLIKAPKNDNWMFWKKWGDKKKGSKR